MDVGGNVLQAASKAVSKDKENDPGAIIEVGRNIPMSSLVRMIAIES